MQEAVDTGRRYAAKGKHLPNNSNEEPIFAAAKFSLSTKDVPTKRRRRGATPPPPDPEEESPKESTIRHSKRLANKHMDFSVFKFDDPIQHLQGEERKLLKQFSMEDFEDDDTYEEEDEVKKKPKGRPATVSKKAAAALKPVPLPAVTHAVTHAKPQALQITNRGPPLVLKLGASAGSPTISSPVAASSETSSPPKPISVRPPPHVNTSPSLTPSPSTSSESVLSSAVSPPLTTVDSPTKELPITKLPATLNETQPTVNTPHQENNYNQLLIPKTEPQSSPKKLDTTMMWDSNPSPKPPESESDTDFDLDEFGAPPIEESSTPFEPELKVENSSYDFIHASHSFESHPDATNGKGSERVKRKYTKRGTGKVALAKAAAKANVVETPTLSNHSEAVNNSNHVTNAVACIPTPNGTPSIYETPSNNNIDSTSVAHAQVERRNAVDSNSLLAIKMEALKMLQQCVTKRLITEAQYKAKQNEFLVSISF